MARFKATISFVAEDAAEARMFIFELLQSLGEEITHWMIDADVKEVKEEDA